MKRNSSWGTWAVALALLVVAPLRAIAADQCPLIRPPGLSPAQLEEVVMTKLVEALGPSATLIDKSKTITLLAGSEDAPLRYALFVVGVGESLGFDAAGAFYAKAKQKGSERPFDAVTIDEYQDVSRQAYFKGKDAAPPFVTDAVSYALHHIAVRPPSSAGWQMLRCATDEIVFQQRSPSGEVSTAMAHTFGLPVFSGSDEFLALTKKTAAAMLSRFGPIRSLEAKIVGSAARPCSQFSASLGSTGSSQLMLARFCYADVHSQFAYAAIFGVTGTSLGDSVPEAAIAFVNSVLPE